MTEKISELIDGRGAPNERRALFDHIIADQSAGRVWRHYHLIGCVLRGEVEPHNAGCAADISARIEARIQAEPGVEAPPSSVVPLRRRAWTSAAKAGAAATLALAASLAVVAVIVLRPGTDAGVASTTPAAAPAPMERVRFGREFGEMLAQHGEFASSPGLNGLIVHAKFVNHQPLER